MIPSLKQMTDRIFSQPALYHGLRAAFLGGLPTGPVLRLLEARKDDVILDVGCGTGFLAEKVAFQRYLGFDHDPKVIQIANQKKIPNAEFTLENVQAFDFGKIRPTKAVLYGILHHLDDQDAARLLQSVRKTGVRWLVTLDPVYSRHHFLSNFLCRLDRGQHVRREEDMIRLIEASGLAIETKLLHYSNTGIAKYITFRLTPR